MIKVIGVRFRKAGKVYYFSPGEYEIVTGDHVIVETARGIEYGYVVQGSHEVEEKKVFQPLKPVIRMATPEDEATEKSNQEKEREAFRICAEKIRKHELEMKLIDTEYTFDNNKVLFYFTADGRIDFRDLVKDLASVFRTRIELRQIGVRDETKIMGGIGICGRPLCCASYLSEFIPVSIKMAKEQNLSLNPTKISGVCGRLMCCLKYEEDTYEELNSRLPNTGDYVLTDEGLKGEVHSVSILRQLVKVVVTINGDEKEIREYRVDQLQFRPKRKKEKNRGEDSEKKREEPEKGLAEAAEKPEKGISEEPERRRPETSERREKFREDAGAKRAERTERSEAAGRRERQRSGDSEWKRTDGAERREKRRGGAQESRRPETSERRERQRNGDSEWKRQDSAERGEGKRPYTPMKRARDRRRDAEVTPGTVSGEQEGQ